MSHHRRLNHVLAAAFWFAAIGAFVAPAVAQTMGQAWAQHSVSQAAPSHTVTLSQLPIATGSSGLWVIPRPRSPVSDSDFAAMKAQAAARRGAAMDAAAATTPAWPSSSGRETVNAPINFDGDNQTEAACQDATPADTALAVGDGTNPIVQVVNLCASVWSPAGARLAGPVTLQSLFRLPAGTSVSSPRALYDWYNHRFIIVMVDSDMANSNHYDIAVSKTDDPAGAYCVYRLSVSSAQNVRADFPRLGQDHTAPYPIQSGTPYPGTLYLAANLLSNSTGNFIYEEWLLAPKQQLYNCQGLGLTSFFNIHNPDQTLAFGSQPANVWSPFDIPRAEFFLESYWNGSNKLVAFAVSNPFGYVSGGPFPELSAVQFNTATPYAIPPNASQPGAANSIFTNDASIYGAVTYNAGYLHAALTSGNDFGGSDAIVYKIHPILNANISAVCTGSFANACPQITAASIEKESVLSYVGNFAYYPTPVPDFEGNVTTVYNFSGATGPCVGGTTGCYASLGYVMQRATQGSGFFDMGQYLQPGTALYNQSSWGLYTAVAPVAVGYQTDATPGRPGMAFSGMYAGPGNCTGLGSGCWFTRIGYTQFNAPNQP